MTSTAPHTAPERPSSGEMLEDVSALVGFVAQAGPPPFLLAGALVFGSLMLAGPFALVVTLFLAVAVLVMSVALVVATVVAIVKAPGMIVRHAHAFVFAHPVRLALHRAPVAVRREKIA